MIWCRPASLALNALEPGSWMTAGSAARSTGAAGSGSGSGSAAGFRGGGRLRSRIGGGSRAPPWGGPGSGTWATKREPGGTPRGMVSVKRPSVGWRPPGGSRRFCSGWARSRGCPSSHLSVKWSWPRRRSGTALITAAW